MIRASKLTHAYAPRYSSPHRDNRPFFLYTRPWIRLELVSLLLLVTLLLIFYLFPFNATEGRLTEVESFRLSVIRRCRDLQLMILARGLTTTGQWSLSCGF